MRRKKTKGSYQKIILFIFAIGALYAGYYWGNRHAIESREYLNFHPLEIPLQLTPIKLLDNAENALSNNKFRNRWNLIIPGHTGTPISASQLTLAVQIHNRLADKPALQKQLQVFFLELDSRDTTRENAESFIHQYNPDFTALVGSPQAITFFSREIGVKFKQLASGEIQHSTSMALISPQGMLLGLFTGRVDAVSISQDMKTIAMKYKKP